MDRKTILIATCAALTAIWGCRSRAHRGHRWPPAWHRGTIEARHGTAQKQCASCHGDDLKGNEIIPGLTGDTFTGNWKGKTVGDLFEKINMTMPALDPGSLSPGRPPISSRSILSVAKYPAGKTALATTMDALSRSRSTRPNSLARRLHACTYRRCSDELPPTPSERCGWKSY